MLKLYSEITLLFQRFTEGYCRFEGSLMENFENIPNEETCQRFCHLSPICKYFIYNKREKVCEILDDDHRQCDTIRGPPSPGYQECQIELLECPSGWTDGGRLGCYYVAKESPKMKYSDAKNFCKSLNIRSHLVEIRSQEIQTFVETLDLSSNGHWWIGATDQQEVKPIG